MTPEQVLKYKKAAENGSMPDEENPLFLFSLTNAKLLVKLLRKDFDLREMVKHELSNRGLDNSGKWIGFKRAGEKRKSNRKANRLKGRKF